MKRSVEGRLGGRLLVNLIIFGLIGQIAWAVENMYFNTFLYNSVYKGASQAATDGSINVFTAINLMVAFSAAAAVLTTFLMGNLSDKLNRRKVFIAAGYIVWGLTIGVFAFITRDNSASLFGLTDEAAILTATVWAVIIMDCVMTFMGSTANDSAFNAWVTDVTNTKNRATTESVLSILPMAANVIVIGLAMMITNIGYAKFFLILGAATTFCGILGLFTLTESRSGKKQADAHYWSNLFYGFRPSVIKANGSLYLTLGAYCIYSIAVQVFFPYLLIYIEKYLGLDLNSLDLTPGKIVLAAAAIIVAVAFILIIGKCADKFGKDKFIIPAALLFMVGLVLASFAHTPLTFLLLMVPGMIGYAVLGIVLNATVRDYTPTDKTGLFQGVRMIFFVLIPMVIGPTIGNIATQHSDMTYLNDYGVATPVPTSSMFVIAAVVSLFMIVPIFFLLRSIRRNKPAAVEAENAAAPEQVPDDDKEAVPDSTEAVEDGGSSDVSKTD